MAAGHYVGSNIDIVLLLLLLASKIYIELIRVLNLTITSACRA